MGERIDVQAGDRFGRLAVIREAERQPRSNGRYRRQFVCGITICDRWRESFMAFLEDMGERPCEATLERIDNSKGYSPDNCRWASRKEQARNRRNNRMLTYRGKTQCLAGWADDIGVSYNVLNVRINNHKWGVERALTQPVRGGDVNE